MKYKTRLLQIALAIFSFAVYYNTFGLYATLFIIVGVGWHEYCHILAAKKFNLSTDGFYFVPFVGAFAPINDPPKTQSNAAVIYLAGPIGGGLLGLLCMILYLTTGSLLFGKAAVFMMLMNIFNLLPFAVLDGGQVANSLAASTNHKISLIWHIISFILTIVFFIWFRPALLVLVLPFGLIKVAAVITDYRESKKLGKQKIYTVPNMEPMNKKVAIQVILTWIIAFGLMFFSIKFLSNHGVDLSTIFYK